MFSLSKEAWATIGNLLKWTLLSVALVGLGFLGGKFKTERDVANDVVTAQQDHAKQTDALRETIEELQQRKQQVVTKTEIIYMEKQNAVTEETNATLDAVTDGTLRLSVQIRDLEARAATAELASHTVQRFHTRRAELHEETSRDLIRLTGDANTVAVRLGECQTYLRQYEDYVLEYKGLVKQFYKDNGYTF